ncbi:MAG: DUF2807 domain-containing protein [Tannerellaceae bacterium]|nr:DUF2807 domain-containing protein [Tannerellaceae bacterium]
MPEFKKIKGDGNLLTKEIHIPDYERIEVSGRQIEISYTQKDQQAGLIITTDSNIYHAYNFSVKDQCLVIEPKEEYENASFAPTTFFITTHSKKLDYLSGVGKVIFNSDAPMTNEKMEIELAGKCSVFLNDKVTIDHLTTELAGSCLFSAKQISGNTFKGELAGKGTLELGGTLHKTTFEIAGKGNIYTFDLQVAEARISIADKGYVELHATENIHWEVAGIDNLRYKGDPGTIRKEVVGIGSVKRADNGL